MFQNWNTTFIAKEDFTYILGEGKSRSCRIATPTHDWDFVSGGNLFDAVHCHIQSPAYDDPGFHREGAIQYKIRDMEEFLQYYDPHLNLTSPEKIYSRPVEFHLQKIRDHQQRLELCLKKVKDLLTGNDDNILTVVCDTQDDQLKFDKLLKEQYDAVDQTMKSRQQLLEARKKHHAAIEQEREADARKFQIFQLSLRGLKAHLECCKEKFGEIAFSPLPPPFEAAQEFDRFGPASFETSQAQDAEIGAGNEDAPREKDPEPGAGSEDAPRGEDPKPGAGGTGLPQKEALNTAKKRTRSIRTKHSGGIVKQSPFFVTVGTNQEETTKILEGFPYVWHPKSDSTSSIVFTWGSEGTISIQNHTKGNISIVDKDNEETLHEIQSEKQLDFKVNDAVYEVQVPSGRSTQQIHLLRLEEEPAPQRGRKRRRP